jgi:ribosomal protein S18 acetylase RimI-like enzyme
LFASTRQAELETLAAWGWDSARRQEFLRIQFNAMRQAYGAAATQATFLIVSHEQTPVGRWVVERGQKEWRVVDVALLPEWRGQGIGTELLQGLLGEASDNNVPVRLQVLANNPAIRLYERLGFARLAENPPYLCMEWNPAQDPATSRLKTAS